MDTTDNTIININRAYTLVSYDMSLTEVGEAMVPSGVSPEDAFLAFHAAKILVRDSEDFAERQQYSKFYDWLEGGCDK